MQKNKNFENQLLKLEEIIKKLETNELSLSQSLEEYKKGIEAIKNCNIILEEAEEKVKKLSEELNNE